MLDRTELDENELLEIVGFASKVISTADVGKQH